MDEYMFKIMINNLYEYGININNHFTYNNNIYSLYDTFNKFNLLPSSTSNEIYYNIQEFIDCLDAFKNVYSMKMYKYVYEYLMHIKNSKNISFLCID